MGQHQLNQFGNVASLGHHSFLSFLRNLAKSTKESVYAKLLLCTNKSLILFYEKDELKMWSVYVFA